jgi:hypothetical protein
LPFVVKKEGKKNGEGKKGRMKAEEEVHIVGVAKVILSSDEDWQNKKKGKNADKKKGKKGKKRELYIYLYTYRSIGS